MKAWVVYRFDDADGQALYVGMTRQLQVRVYSGHNFKPWMASAAVLTWSEPMTKQDAIAAERAEIARLRPRFNKRHNPDWRMEKAA